MRYSALVLICALMGGCASNAATTVEIIEGCMIRIEGISTLQAEVIIKEWNIDPNCTVDVITELNQE